MNCIHSLSNTKIYLAWQGMKARCGNKNNPSYINYGKRGIKICKRWLGKRGFLNFLADMGLPPSKNHSLDRINNNDDYRPSNCRWATKSEQNFNRRKRKNSTSKYKHICFCKERNQWSITYYFHTEKEAIRLLKILDKITKGV